MFSSLGFRRSFYLGARLCLDLKNPSKPRSYYKIEDELAEFLDLTKTSSNARAPAISTITKCLTKDQGHYVPFRDLINTRRAEAKRSLYVQVRSQESADDLNRYCTNNFGKVKALHFHQNKNSDAFSNFFIVEFEDEECVNQALFSHCQHSKNSGNLPIPVYSPFLWFSGKNENENGNGVTSPESESSVPIFLAPKSIDSDAELIQHLSQFSTLDEQMLEFLAVSELSSISTRIRFLACHQVELCLQGLFSKARVHPFGSSVNTFGSNKSDLDMVVSFDTNSNNGNSRLMFQAKGLNHGLQRLQSQRYCDQISNMLQHFLPGCQEVQSILHARVPIVKYKQQLLGLECDVSVSSLSGFYMSELLYLFGELDFRVRPLIYTIRRWAKDQGLIQDTRPTPSFTSFSVTLLVVFFLQKKYKMLPPIQELKRLAGPQDDITCDDGVRCHFLRDVSGIQPHFNAYFHDRSLTLAQMLTDFFEFYAFDFDYNRDAACVFSGDIQPKRFLTKNGAISARNVSYSLDITNPLEHELNVTANVQDFAVRKFRLSCDEALKKLYGLQTQQVSSSDMPKLMFLFSTKALTSLNIRISDLGPLNLNSDETSDALNESGAKVKPAAQLLKDGVQTSKISHGEHANREKGKFHDEKRRQEELKKKYLRLPKARKFFVPKF